MKKLVFVIVLAAVPLLLLLNSCRKDPLKHLTSEETRVYSTQRDSSVNFSSFKTFSIVDSVVVIENDQQPHRELTDADSKLLQEIKDQMQQKGYVPVGKDQDPDLGVNVTRISNSYLNIVQYPYDWWGYPGYWDPYYWGYPGYGYYFPPSFGIYQSQEDLLTIDLINLRDADKNSDKQIDGIWNATIRGDAVLESRNYNNEIKAVFDQSPYLASEQ